MIFCTECFNSGSQEPLNLVNEGDMDRSMGTEFQEDNKKEKTGQEDNSKEKTGLGDNRLTNFPQNKVTDFRHQAEWMVNLEAEFENVVIGGWRG